MQSSSFASKPKNTAVDLNELFRNINAKQQEDVRIIPVQQT